MRRFAVLLAGLAGLASIAALFAAAPFPRKTPTGGVGRFIKPFKLDDANGKAHSFADCKDSKAIVIAILGTECPLNNAYIPVLAALHKEYEQKGVRFFGVNSNVHDTPARILAHVQANKIPFPVLKDTANILADQLGARRTPEAFVLSPAGKVLYQGRIDDQIGIGFRRKEANRRDLAVALDEVLAGKAVSVPFTEAPGCLIARAIKPKQDGKITYAKHISRLMQNRCQECHRPGQVAPMPLLTYNDVVAWSQMIAEVVKEKRMPPWHADPKYGKFLNDRHLSDEERKMLLAWVADDCPKGDEKDLPAEKKWEKGWQIGKPDAVFQMPEEFKVPADAGTRGVKYQYFFVQTNYDEDRWIQAAEARPGAREVVHHILVYIFERGQRRPRTSDGIGQGLLVAFAPGDLPMKLPAGHAKKLPKGALLVFQMHYTPDGVERKDRSSVAIRFAKEAPKHEVRTRAIAQQLLFIPPGSKNYSAKSRSTFGQEVTLLSFLPHMHVRGKDFKYVVTYPGDKTETLLSVPKYDFNWQTNYNLAKPLKLPAGSRIDCTAHFDNSADNPNNPDPKKWVRWGDQTWEEMMIGFVDYAVERDAAKKK